MSAENINPMSPQDIENIRTIAYMAHRQRVSDEAIARQQQIIAGLHQTLQGRDEAVNRLGAENARLRAELEALRPVPLEEVHAAG